MITTDNINSVSALTIKKKGKENHVHDHGKECNHDLSNQDDSGNYLLIDDHKTENMNIRAAYIHIIGDIIQSVGVLIAAIILYFYPQYWLIDPCCTFFFSILVLSTTIPIFIDCIKVFMEATPGNIDIDKLIKDLNKVRKIFKNYSNFTK